jgi:hypothetical protein
MSNEEDSFQGVASQCMNALVLGLNTRLDASLQVIFGVSHGSSGRFFTKFARQSCSI